MVHVLIPQWVARLNRHVTNPLQRLWAGRVPAMGNLEHIGRTSGRPYRTPLNVFTTDDGVAVLLTYGRNSDWLKNLTAAGGAQLRRHGKTVAVTEPRVVTRAEAARHVKGLAKPVFRFLPFENAVLLHQPR